MYTITTRVDCNTKEFHHDMLTAHSILSDNLSITTHVDCNTKEFHYDMLTAQSVLSDNLSIITVIYLESSSAFRSFSNVNLYLWNHWIQMSKMLFGRSSAFLYDFCIIQKFNMSSMSIMLFDWMKFQNFFSATMCVMEMLHGRNVSYMTL